jgi:dTDP-4-amino-4,6-dideoxygalactose transaminase
VYHLYVILVDDRDGLSKYLNEKGVGTGLHYPVPLHLQKAYAAMGYKQGDFPVTESVAKRLLSLPMFPELTKAQIEYVAQNIKDFMNSK